LPGFSGLQMSEHVQALRPALAVINVIGSDFLREGSQDVTCIGLRVYPDPLRACQAIEVVGHSFSNTEQICLVVDNLTIYTATALSETFPAGEAYRICHCMEGNSTR
jgi:hypothetical protein